MFLFKSVALLQKQLKFAKDQKRPVGFVPTMGALHEGHLSLIRQSRSENDLTVCSIFVNPTQFNDPADLKKYPRTPGKDILLLEKVGCDLLFMPPVDEIYPLSGAPGPSFLFAPIDEVMEGRFRPGHFQGVAQVVSRLLDIVQPERLYLGQKDYQQFCIIRAMLEQLQSAVRLVLCPIIREEDGLAMSSRNVRLTPAYRQKATEIYQTLIAARKMMAYAQPAEIRQYALERLSTGGLEPEYFEIADMETLLPLETFNGGTPAIACVAVRAGDVRLIDNMILHPS